MTTVGNSYVMFGGLYVKTEAKETPIKAETTDEVYTLRIGLSKTFLLNLNSTAFKFTPLWSGFSFVRFSF